MVCVSAVGGCQLWPCSVQTSCVVYCLQLFAITHLVLVGGQQFVEETACVFIPLKTTSWTFQYISLG